MMRKVFVAAPYARAVRRQKNGGVIRGLVVGLILLLTSGQGNVNSSRALTECGQVPWSDSTQVVFTLDSTGIPPDVKLDTLSQPPSDFVEITAEPQIIRTPKGRIIPQDIAEKYDGSRVETLLWIRVDGTVGQVKMKKCVPVELRPHIVKLACSCLFSPARIADGPIAVRVQVPFRIQK